jgi:hypothetical protein
METAMKGVTNLEMPSLDAYGKGYLKHMVQNFSTSEKLTNQYFTHYDDRLAGLQKRQEDVKAREKKIAETIQKLLGAKSALRVETPKAFPSNIDYDVTKTLNTVIKAEKSLIRNDKFEENQKKNEGDNSMLREKNSKGEEPKIGIQELNESIKITCQNHKIPLVFAINSQSQNLYLEKIQSSRTAQTKARMRYIDSVHVFNTNDNIFSHYLQDKLAEKKLRRGTIRQVDPNPILEPGNTGNYNHLEPANDDKIEASFTPKTKVQINLLDAPMDSLFGNEMFDTTFLNDRSNALFDGQTEFLFDNLLKPMMGQTSQPNQSTQSTTAPTQGGMGPSIAPPSNQGGMAPTMNAPPPPPVIPNIPPPPPGVIPPPPPISILL